MDGQDHRLTRELLQAMAMGQLPEAIMASRPEVKAEDFRLAARAALDAMDRPRIESFPERKARLRKSHPRAFEPWTEEEDARLLRRFDEGATVAALSKEFQRKEGAIRTRLEKWLGPSWRGA